MNRIPLRTTAVRPLRAALATALLSLSVGAALAVPAWDDYVEPTAFEQNFPVSGPAIAAVVQPDTSIVEYTDNQISEALFAQPEIVELLVALAGIDPLQTP